MQNREIFKYIEQWAPREVAFNKDNPGLQIGDPLKEVSGVLVSLEVDKGVIQEALDKKLNLIVTHHPFLYRPLSQINYQNYDSQLVQLLIKNDISLYSAHTNLDFTKKGVSFQLAKTLGLKDIMPLSPTHTNQYKLVVYTPLEAVEKVAAAIYSSGAGNIGEYSECSFRTDGTGTFRPSVNAKPSIGSHNKLTKVEETKLEILIDKWQLNKAVHNLKLAHPYEEPAFDIVPIENKNPEYGMGAIGYYEEPIKMEEFLELVSSKLAIPALRCSHYSKDKIKRVALCGGSGSELLDAARSNAADCFITADIKYHTFQGVNDLLLIDAGHYETEQVIIGELVDRLNEFLKENKISAVKYSGSTNPINYFVKRSI